MQIRHTGIFVQNIDRIDSILLQLGYEKTYDEDEYINYKFCNVKKYMMDNKALEVIQDSTRARSNIFHVSFGGNIPDFMKQYGTENYIPVDGNLLVDFVYINDSIYFEFVRNKDEH